MKRFGYTSAVAFAIVAADQGAMGRTNHDGGQLGIGQQATDDQNTAQAVRQARQL